MAKKSTKSAPKDKRGSIWSGPVIASIIVAFIGLAGVAVTAYSQNVVPIRATQMAEAKLTQAASLPTVTPGSVTLSFPAATAIETPSLTPPHTDQFDSPPSPFSGNWVVPFEYHFGDGAWSLGVHTYTIDVSCDTSGLSSSTTPSFTVSESAELLDEPVYLRLGGVFKVELGGTPITTVHPLQKTTGLVSRVNLTEADVYLAISDCKASIFLDNGLPQSLVAGRPYQVFQNVP